ncbi:MAG: ABC transporter ATP-binding protein, partial [Xanthomonadales bacterium]|nr:ABC transporter ATP-binding protein [Xanthomonadales bacterium]
MTAPLRVTELTRRFSGSDRPALENVSFQAREGELLTLIGASGSGKTSLLRIVAGLESADAGEVRLGDVLLNRGRQILVPPEKRHVGFVFQNHALFPHLKVEENVAFGLRGLPEQRRRVADLLDMVGLTAVAGRYPHQISGGERQRVALIRALATKPSLMLMDEPFSSLDHSLRNELRGETRRLIQQAGITTLFVTHDAEDALAISDRIVVLREGGVQQIGTPDEIYHHPENHHVARSFGPCNFLIRSELKSSDRLASAQGIEPERLRHEAIWLRPEDLALLSPGEPGALAEGVLKVEHFMGDSRMLTLEC